MIWAQIRRRAKLTPAARKTLAAANPAQTITKSTSPMPNPPTENPLENPQQSAAPERFAKPPSRLRLSKYARAGSATRGGWPLGQSREKSNAPAKALNFKTPEFKTDETGRRPQTFAPRRPSISQAATASPAASKSQAQPGSNVTTRTSSVS